MKGMRSLNEASNCEPKFPGKRATSPILEIDLWMPSEVRAISPLVDRLMKMMEGSQCVSGEEFGIELALREALNNAVLHGNHENPETKVHIRCRCQPGGEISIIVTDQGKGFDFQKIIGNGITSEAASEHGRGIQLMKAYMDEVRFERGGTEVHMRKRSQAARS
jgi:serine/threonine-protein kinase RsbW